MPRLVVIKILLMCCEQKIRTKIKNSAETNASVRLLSLFSIKHCLPIQIYLEELLLELLGANLYVLN